MWTRAALLGFVAGVIATGCGRTGVPVAGPEAEPTVATPIADRLAAPVRVTSDGEPLVREGYHSLYPHFGDLDGTGRPALLLGTTVTHDEGRLLVYRDLGTGREVRLGAPQWFDDTVPTGRIPRG